MFRFFEKKRGLSIIITIVLAVIIFYLSSLSLKVVPGTSYLSIVYHIVIFFLLSFFLFVSIKGNNRIKARHIFLTLLIAVLYAFSDEFHQLFIPGRTAGFEDILFDITGIFLSVFIYSSTSLKKPKTIFNYGKRGSKRC